MKDNRYLAHGPNSNKPTGYPVSHGDELIDFRGDRAILVSIEFPTHLGSTGRVYVRDVHDESPQPYLRGFYPGVYNLEWAGSIELDGNDKLTRESPRKL